MKLLGCESVNKLFLVSHNELIKQTESYEILDCESIIPFDSTKITKLVFCSGELYYELLQKREDIKDQNTALVRLEQLYPLPIEEIKDIIKKYNPDRLIWAQEEPENMGAWSYLLTQLRSYSVELISRSASAASGSSRDSAIRQTKIIDKVFKS